MLKFSNPGEIDSRAITVLGVNAKENSAPIGYFGTGLKYVIASQLRLGRTIVIFSGTTRHDFSLEMQTIRGKEFQFIRMTEEAEGEASSSLLGFTTEFGKNWKDWMLYRELLSNALDEGGEVECAPWFSFLGEAGRTTIYVSGLDEQDEAREKVFLSPKTTFERAKMVEETKPDIQFIPNGLGIVYYRGVRVHEIKNSSRYSFVVNSHVELTEDRTIGYFPWIASEIRDAVLKADNEKLIENFLLAQDGSFESELSWGVEYPPASETFDSVCCRLVERAGGRVSKSIWSRVEKLKANAEPTRLELSPVEEKMLEKALAFLATIRVVPKFEIIVAENLGANVLGIAKGGKIYLASSAFALGTKQLAGTIFEEWVHLEFDVRDYSRALQNILIDKIMSLGEEINGEPI